jgi:hypothetical protein
MLVGEYMRKTAHHKIPTEESYGPGEATDKEIAPFFTGKL